MITVFGCPVNSDYLEMLLKSAGYDPADESGVVKIVATDDGKVTVHWPSGGTSELVNASSSMTFLSLPDTPDSYSGSETFYVKVNSAGTGLVFVSGEETDELVKTSSADSTAGYLGDKIDSDTLAVDTASQTIKVKGGVFASAGHTHDDRYYTETETDNLLGAKADKVSGATSGNFAGLDTNGNLTDSGKKASDFAAASHTHTASDISDFDTEVSNNTDVAANTSARHSHSNKSLLDSLISSGSGTNFLADDGTYKAGTSGSDEKVAVSSSTTAGYLYQLISGSLTIDTATMTLQLSGDDAAPGGCMFYGTNSAGVTGWYSQSAIGSCTTSSGTSGGDRGVFGGGEDGSNARNEIDYVEISTLSNAADFGDLTIARYGLAGTSNGSDNRGVFGGGNGSSTSNTIDYISIDSPGNASDFGDLTAATYKPAATSNNTNGRGVFGGGDVGSNHSNKIDYIAIGTPGNASDFGDLTVARQGLGATSNGANRGVFGGGYSVTNVIDYINISALGNASDFGDLTVARQTVTATSNNTNDRGVFAMGHNGSAYVNTIDYITISTAGNASDFGDLTVARGGGAGTSNGEEGRGVFGGGQDSSGKLNIIDYITISTTGNASDFGDLTVARSNLAAASNA